MKFCDINKRFTELVIEYISKGYTFNTASMGGSQGEIRYHVIIADHDFGPGVRPQKILCNRQSMTV